MVIPDSPADMKEQAKCNITPRQTVIAWPVED